MIRRSCDSSLNRTVVSYSRPWRSIQISVGAVDHDLRDRVVDEEPLERAVAEDVVGDLVRQALALVARDPDLVGEVALDVDETRSRSAAGSVATSDELRAELGDHAQVDAVLQLGVRLELGGRDGRAWS